MRARAAIVATSGPAGTRYSVLRSEPPLLLRPTPDALLLVGGAAGPLGGDALSLEVVVEPGTTLCVASAAATVVLPGAKPSHLDLKIQVGDGAHLDWCPEPLVSVVGSHHRIDARIELATTATLRFQETLVLGRSGERSGAVAAHLRVERAGRALHHQSLELGGESGDAGPAITGDASVVRTVVEVGPPADVRLAAAKDDVWAAVLPVADDASVLQVLGPDTVAVEAACAALFEYGDGRWSDHKTAGPNSTKVHLEAPQGERFSV